MASYFVEATLLCAQNERKNYNFTQQSEQNEMREQLWQNYKKIQASTMQGRCVMNNINDHEL